VFRVPGSLPSGAVSQMALAGRPAGPGSHPSALRAPARRTLAGWPLMPVTSGPAVEGPPTPTVTAW
jgi:hypothetical protein